MRQRFTEGVRRMAQRLAGLLGSKPAHGRREDTALAVIATLVGALVLARAVDDSELSDRILRAAKVQLTNRNDG